MKYEELAALAKIVSRNKVKQIEVLGSGSEASSYPDQLYRDLQEDVFGEEEEAIEAYFGGKPHKRRYFNRVKRSLRERLINTLFFVDTGQSDFSNFQRAYYSCYRYAAAVRILMGRSGRKAAVPLAEHTLEKALRFEFTDIILMMANQLRYHYGVIESDVRKFQEYNDLVQEQAEIQQVELKLEAYYTELGLHFSGSKESRPEVLEIAKNYAAYAEVQVGRYQSYRLNMYAHSIITLRYQINYEHEELMKACARAVAFFEEKKQRASNTALYLFSMRMLPSMIIMQQYKEAEHRIQYCLKLVECGDLNYFKVLEHYILLGFYSEQFEMANNINRLAHGTSGFKQQYANSSEYWKLYDAYIHLLQEMGKIKSPSGNSSFRLGRFLNAVPHYSRDKRGANIAILVLQVLFLLQQKRYYDIIDKADSLRQYTFRYLRKNDTFRSNCFLKMLLLLPHYSFKKEIILKRAAHLEKRLQEMPLSKARQSLEVEIVPYEVLWKLTLELL